MGMLVKRQKDTTRIRRFRSRWMSEGSSRRGLFLSFRISSCWISRISRGNICHMKNQELNAVELYHVLAIYSLKKILIWTFLCIINSRRNHWRTGWDMWLSLSKVRCQAFLLWSVPKKQEFHLNILIVMKNSKLLKETRFWYLHYHHIVPLERFKWTYM